MRKYMIFLLLLLVLFACSKEGGKIDRYTIYDKVIDHSKPLWEMIGMCMYFVILLIGKVLNLFYCEKV